MLNLVKILDLFFLDIVPILYRRRKLKDVGFSSKICALYIKIILFQKMVRTLTLRIKQTNTKDGCGHIFFVILDTDA